MAKRPRKTSTNLSNSSSLRLRAAWLYHNRGWTQKAIAENLGISRSTVIRMLDDARKRAEVQIWINPMPNDCTELALALEEKYGLGECIVVPGDGTPEESANEVGAALGQYLTEIIADDMLIGTAWGRTLNAALQTFRPTPRKNTQVISLLGGILDAKNLNPIDFTWQLASRLHARSMLYLAPLLVDSLQTKTTLIENCGLNRLYELAQNLDLAIISCGDLGPNGSSQSLDLLTQSEHDSLISAGAICDAGCNFLTANGEDVSTDISTRMMNVDMDTLSSAKHVVLASGGRLRAPAIRATILRSKCQTLVTNEGAALALLEL